MQCVVWACDGFDTVCEVDVQRFPLAEFCTSVAKFEFFMSVYVGNLSYEVDRQDLDSVFSEYGNVTRISLPIDREMDRPRGFAFVDMASPAQEEAVIETLDGAEWYGRTIRVNYARPRSEDSEPKKHYRRNQFDF